MKEFIQEKNHIRVSIAEKVSFKVQDEISTKQDAKCSRPQILLPLTNSHNKVLKVIVLIILLKYPDN